ncbi:MAG: S49 family peptidase, partial [Gammaproteobacteria bacterium]|nr:S49 family peptidase [Gammaproteobacteria bacterium]
HKQFIEQVRKGRGDRLSSEAEVFSGLVWSGEQALALGLIDGLGSPGHVARDVIGEERVVDYSYSPSPMQQFLRQLGVSFAGALATEVLQGSVRLR